MNDHALADLDALKAAHSAYADNITDPQNEIIIPEEYINGRFRENLRNKKSRDMVIMPLERAKELFKDKLTEGKQKRLIVLKDEDITEELKRIAKRRPDHRILGLTNYHFLHLSASLELARSVLTSDIEAIRDFYKLLTNEELDITDTELTKPVMMIKLPEIKDDLLDDLENILNAHAEFLEAA
jgi:hypothetical protein